MAPGKISEVWPLSHPLQSPAQGAGGLGGLGLMQSILGWLPLNRLPLLTLSDPKLLPLLGLVRGHSS